MALRERPGISGEDPCQVSIARFHCAAIERLNGSVIYPRRIPQGFDVNRRHTNSRLIDDPRDIFGARRSREGARVRPAWRRARSP